MAQIDDGQATGSAVLTFGPSPLGVAIHVPLGVTEVSPSDRPFLDPSGGSTQPGTNTAIVPINASYSGIKFALPA